MDLSKEKGQFILSKEKKAIVSEWNLRQKGSWTLSSHPSLLVADIFTRDDIHIGWLLGYPVVFSKRKFCPNKIILNIDFGNLTPETAEKEIYEFGGRFVCVFLTDTFQRLYLDPAGSLSCAYSLGRSMIASSPALLDSEGAKHEPDLLKALNMASSQSGTWFPCGLTPVKNVRILLPNHFLNLHKWQTERHWPKKDIKNIGIFKSPSKIAKKIAELIKDTIDIVAANHLLSVTLTAGSDSRILLACCRDMIDKTLFVTSDEGVENVDLSVSKILSKLFALQHSVKSSFDANRIVLLGFGGEAAKGIYYRKKDTRLARLKPEDLLERLGYPVGNRHFLEEITMWLSEVNGFSPFLINDLMYVEQRLGCCMGPVMYAYDKRGGGYNLYPINQRKIFELIFKLPVAYKKENRLAIDICRLMWPELLRVPINADHFTGAVKYKKLLQELCSPIKGKTAKIFAENKKLIVKMASRDRPVTKMLLDDIAKVANKPFKWLKHTRYE